MSTDIRLKHSKVASRVPTSGDLKDGELGLNLADEKIYMKNADGDVVQVAGKGGGDGEYVKVAGDTMTGQLTLPGGGSGNEAATVSEVNSAVSNAAYVEKAGDNMTGNLTLGTDKITLNASGGNITTEGSVNSGKIGGSEVGCIMNNTGSIFTRRDDGTSVDVAFAAVKGAYDIANGVWKIYYDGSMFMDGSISVSDKITLDASGGAASFAGTVTAPRTSLETSGRQLDESPLILNNTNNDGYSITSQSNGTVTASLATNGAFVTEGSGTFAGTVTSTVDNAYAFAVNGGGFFGKGNSCSLYIKNGSTYAIGTWNGEDDNRLQMGDGSTSDYKITLEGNTGNAEFDGTVTAPNITFNLEPDNEDNYTTTTEEYEETIQVPVVGGGVATADLVNGAPEQQFTEKTVTRTREIKTYTGPTLDVKESVLDLQQRLDTRDAQLEQALARIQELESADSSALEARIAALEVDMNRFKAI